jgi:hypothetical protein
MAKKLLNMSAVLRAGYDKLVKAGWDVNTVSSEEIVEVSRKTIRGKNKADTSKMREAFNPTPAQVSIVKREYTKGSPTGRRGRPTHASIGLEDAA